MSYKNNVSKNIRLRLAQSLGSENKKNHKIELLRKFMSLVIRKLRPKEAF